MEATLNGKPIRILYVNSDLTWLIVTEDMQNETRRLKVDTEVVEGVTGNQLLNFRNKLEQKGKGSE
jgi:hypothetical protein